MALFLLFVAFFSLVQSQSVQQYPFPFPTGISPCDMTQSPPGILSIHVHIVFNGQNETTAKAAFDLRNAFIAHTNVNMPTCPFPHPYAGADYHNLCVFETHGDKFPYPIDAIFGQSNLAFFIPLPFYLNASIWFRQHYNPLLVSYMFHVNTGCETNDHGIWAMVNENYPYPTNTSALLCCHDGPINCYCSITQYFSTKNNKNCISADYESKSVQLSTCNDDDWAYSWRETHYNSTFVQIENVGTSPTGGNTYMCLGQSKGNVCNKGNALELIKCYQTDERLVLFNYDANDQKIKTMRCGADNLCVSVDANGRLILDDCSNAPTFGSTDSW